MTKRFNPPSAPRLGVVALAAALAAFAGAASAQTGGASPGLPGYATSSDGRVVLSGFGQCVRSGFWSPANAAEPCDRVARAAVPPPPVAVAQPAPQPEPAPAPAPVAAPEPPRP